MARVNITKPTGSVESLNILSAFKVENNIYIVLDGEKMGSMGLPIIYVCKYKDKLEKINDANEWQSVKNYLKGIISGTNFEYVKIGDNLTADEAYYTPLTLPQSSFDAIKARYAVENTSNQSGETPTLTSVAPGISPVMPNASTVSNTAVNITPVVGAPTELQQESVMNLIDDAYKVKQTPVPPAATPTQATSPANVTPEPVISNIPTAPEFNVTPSISEVPTEESKVTSSKTIDNVVEINSNKMNFDNDKETFLKACENMFDALISKYQKELNALDAKEKELEKKEAEINAKLKDANEHLANAEAREQVANIAHDNAQRVMDLNNFMPVNPNDNQS